MNLFRKVDPSLRFAQLLVGDWRAEADSGQVHSLIHASFKADGTFSTHTTLTREGAAASTIAQHGRYTVEAIDRQRCRVLTADEEGTAMGSSVRTFLNEDTMETDIGRLVFFRLMPTL